MAEYVTVRHRVTGEELTKPKTAVDLGFFPEYDVLDAAGRKKAAQPATAPAVTAKKEN